jgi:hypothetical protein
MFPPIELCYLPHPCRRPSINLGPNHKDPVRILHLLQTRLPRWRCSHHQRLRRHLDRLATLQPENTVTPAREPKIVSNNERSKTIVAM